MRVNVGIHVGIDVRVGIRVGADIDIRIDRCGSLVGIRIGIGIVDIRVGDPVGLRVGSDLDACIDSGVRIARVIRIVVAVVGSDPMTGDLRFDFGVLELSGGVNRIAVLMEWAYAYVTWRRSARVILDAPSRHRPALERDAILRSELTRSSERPAATD